MEIYRPGQRAGILEKNRPFAILSTEGSQIGVFGRTLSAKTAS
jgi:hypothetical protein